MATGPDNRDAQASKRELAAIMFSDIAGYTAIMGRDEERAIHALAEHRALLRTLLPRFNGRMLGDIGDGTLTIFHSASDAVNCAREVQSAIKDSPDFQLRIGIHLGDVLFSGDNALGDGVNIASRIHALASPGSICVSGAVYDEIRNKPGMAAKSLGQKNLKNVSRPISVYIMSRESDSTATVEAPTRTSGRRRYAAVAGVAAIATAAVAYFAVIRRYPASNPVTSSASSPHTIRSLVVLPLDNYSGNPNQEYFADGMTDELTTDLATISQLRVISRGSAMRFKGEHRPATPEIAKALNVDAIVEGSVLRVGDKVRITAQLIDARVYKHIWAKSFERASGDVLALQDELASAIAKEIEVQLTPGEQARLTSAASVNPAAHDAYLEGRYFFSHPSDANFRRAIAKFEEAIKLDPNFAPAYSGLSDAYLWAGLNERVFTAAEAMPKAKAAAEKSIQLDDTLAEAHASLGTFKFNYEFDWTGSEREFRRAIELNPSYAYAHDQYGQMLAMQGRLDEAWVQNQRAAELDPFGGLVVMDMVVTLTWQGKYDAAKELSRKTLDLDPTDGWVQWASAWTDIEAGKSSAAVPELQKFIAATFMEYDTWFTGWLGYAYGASGDRTRAIAVLEELNEMSAHGYVPQICLAYVYLGLGDRVRALDRLEKAYEAHAQQVILIKMDRIFDPLRSEPRFIALMKKLRLDK